ncbi:hypothetical protein [Alteribacter aurantiacus]|uniref:hypothetical protein n=1 Tax=Alteribacter aurantiacus TaxID=254410 RepID=UPI0003FAC617|nr:hypothetical protein [Alteribacter aurantiacus]
MYYTKEEIRMMLDHLDDNELVKVYDYIVKLKRDGKQRRSMNGASKSNGQMNGRKNSAAPTQMKLE